MALDASLQQGVKDERHSVHGRTVVANRFMIISADCHAAARWPDYESYFERRHLDAYREWYGASGKVNALRPGENRLFDKNFLDELLA